MARNSTGLEILKPRKLNPRTMTDADRARLSKTLKEFGDLGGIVRNRRTGELVGGHQRVAEFRKDKKARVVIEKQVSDSVGTVAVGYVESGGTRFSYREVDWDAKREAAANLAANRVHGDFVMDDVGTMIQELGVGFDFDLTGFGATEIEDILGTGTPDEKKAGSLADQFGIPPFSILDARQGYWQERKRAWLALGIRSELGRGGSPKTSPKTSARAQDGKKKTYREI